MPEQMQPQQQQAPPQGDPMEAIQTLGASLQAMVEGFRGSQNPAAQKASEMFAQALTYFNQGVQVLGGAGAPEGPVPEGQAQGTQPVEAAGTSQPVPIG